MRELFMMVRANGDYMKKDNVEYKVDKDCNGFYRLHMRFTEDEPRDWDDGWRNIYVTQG